MRDEEREKDISMMLEAENAASALEEFDQTKTAASSDPCSDSSLVLLEGNLYKWTNLFYGWKLRYVVLRGSVLSYFLNKDEADTMCRGSYNIRKSKIETNMYDECAFCITTSDSVIHLRSDTVEERIMWIEKLNQVKKESSSPDKFSRTQSISSCLSDNVILGMRQNPENAALNLDMRIQEMHNFKEQIYHQIESMQRTYDLFGQLFTSTDLGIDMVDSDEEQSFDYDSSVHQNCKKETDVFFCKNCEPIKKLNQSNIDFTGESIAFTAAASGLLATMSHCIEIINTYNEKWKTAFERAREKKNNIQEKYTDLYRKYQSLKMNRLGPEFEEGPVSRLNEDEFYDAIDTAYEIEEELEEEKKLNLESNQIVLITGGDIKKHRFSELRQKKLEFAIKLLTESVADDPSWECCLYSSNSKVYKKNVDIDELAVDPYRVTSFVEGVTAKELCSTFYDPDERLFWDQHCETVRVLEKFTAFEVILHQKHKQVWPAKRRDTCFFSFISECEGEVSVMVHKSIRDETEDYQDYVPLGRAWIVVNFSVDHEDSENGECIRATADVGLLAQTFIRPCKNGELTRADIVTKMNYIAEINLGGWLPVAAVRKISQREFPKFADKFGSYVKSKHQDRGL